MNYRNSKTRDYFHSIDFDLIKSNLQKKHEPSTLSIHFPLIIQAHAFPRKSSEHIFSQPRHPHKSSTFHHPSYHDIHRPLSSLPRSHHKKTVTIDTTQNLILNKHENVEQIYAESPVRRKSTKSSNPSNPSKPKPLPPSILRSTLSSNESPVNPMKKKKLASKERQKKEKFSSPSNKTTPSFTLSHRLTSFDQNTSINPLQTNPQRNPLEPKPNPSRDSYISSMIAKYSNTCKSYSHIKGASFKTEAGSLDGGKTKKQNQDSFVFEPEFGGQRDRHLFGVFDGHGKKGHLVSGFVKGNFGKILERELGWGGGGKDWAQGNGNRRIEEGMKRAFEEVDKGLRASGIDCEFSGTTANVVLIEDDLVYCANVGDSRAILSENPSGSPVAYALSEDHKPEDPKEKARIEANGGRVDSLKDPQGLPYGPARVWLKNQNLPGLAMSRSIGDYYGRKAGVISTPEITKRKLDQFSQMLVLGSDGIFEFLENQKIVNLLAPYCKVNNPDKASFFLSKEASRLWKKEEDVIDDITCIIVFLNF